MSVGGSQPCTLRCVAYLSAGTGALIQSITCWDCGGLDARFAIGHQTGVEAGIGARPGPLPHASLGQAAPLTSLTVANHTFSKLSA